VKPDGAGTVPDGKPAKPDGAAMEIDGRPAKPTRRRRNQPDGCERRRRSVGA
jgi:hypothetical protein